MGTENYDDDHLYDSVRSLNRNTILFWDEPETNMNPKMIRPDRTGIGCSGSDGGTGFCINTRLFYSAGI